MGWRVGEDRASPLEALTVRAESPGTEGEEGRTEGIAVGVEGQRRGIGKVTLVTFVEGDDEGEVPVGLEEIVS